MAKRAFGCLGLVVAILTGWAAVAAATTVGIDFESGTYSSVGQGVDNVYQEDGFTFRTLSTEATAHFDSGPNAPAFEFGGPFPFLDWHNGPINPGLNPIEFHAGGQPFDLISLQVVPVPVAGEPSMLFTASNGNTLTVGQGFLGLLTFPEGFRNITSVQIDLDPLSEGEDRGMDNVVLEIPARVPEPATLLLLGAGTLALYAFGRSPRRKS